MMRNLKLLKKNTLNLFLLIFLLFLIIYCGYFEINKVSFCPKLWIQNEVLSSGLAFSLPQFDDEGPNDAKGFYVKLSNNPIYYPELEILANESSAVRRESCNVNLPTQGINYPVDVVNTYKDYDVIVLGPILWGTGIYHPIIDQLVNLVQLLDVIKHEGVINIVREFPEPDKVIDYYKLFDFGRDLNFVFISNRPHRFRNAYLPSGNKCGHAPPARLHRLRQLLRVRAPTMPPANGVILYLSRLGSSRNPPNSDEVIGLLRQKYQTRLRIHSMDLSASESAKLVQRASAIVGPHGAGEIHIIFAAPNTSVLEISPTPMNRNFPFNLCYQKLAKTLELRYRILGFPGNPKSFDGPINTSLVISTLEQMLSH